MTRGRDNLVNEINKASEIRLMSAVIENSENQASVIIANSASTPFSSLIKQWRALRKCSQLDLALEAGVSQRHVSFLESGRAKPSRDMVLNLAEALDLPLRDRNVLLNTAGFTPAFKERTLDSEDMQSIQHALKMTLDHHEPYPAIVADRNWNLHMTNQAALGLIGFLGNPEEIWQRVDPSGDKNVYRMTFHPEGMRPLISNWEVLSKHLLLRLQREINADPYNDYLKQLLSDVVKMSGSELEMGCQEMAMPLAPVLPMQVSLGKVTLSTFSMISSFGTAQDITAEELRVETFFPADEFTADFFKQIARQEK